MKMILRSTLTTLAALLMTGAAWAQPVLRADIVVAGALVTLGDMFDQPGEQAGEALFRAPRPGTSGVVDVGDIAAALNRIGIARFDAAGLTGIRVTRAATVVDEAMLTDLIAADLDARGILTAGMSLDALFATPITPITAEAVPQPVTIANLRYLPGSGAFSARFTIAGIDQPLDVSGTIELLIEVPHVISSLPAGTLLSPEDIEMRPVPLRFVESAGAARLDDVIGKTLIRQSREGMMLRPADIATPLLVSKNEPVTIYFRQGPMTLTVKGQAVTAAAAGAPLQVLNLMSRRVISAIAIAPGAVEVGSAPLTVAGL
jgi:flagella basal body P-ring formation protein FlgA